MFRVLGLTCTDVAKVSPFRFFAILGKVVNSVRAKLSEVNIAKCVQKVIIIPRPHLSRKCSFVL